jgi:hypothetical protein
VSALVGDQRILSATAQVTFDRASNELTVAINAQGANGPFSLTLAASAVTVSILRPS